MRGVRKYHIVGCLAATLILMVMVPGNRAQAQTILSDSFDNYVTMFGDPDQAAFQALYPIDGSCQSNIVSNDANRYTTAPISLRQNSIPGLPGASNKRDLVPLIQALDPTKSAVIGTDENPLILSFSLDLPRFGSDNQLAKQSTRIVELTNGVDRAPVGPITMVDCGGGVFRPKIPLTDGTIHGAFAIGVLAQLDQDPCDTDPEAPGYPQVPVVAQVVVYDGAQWNICIAGTFGLDEDALVAKRWNHVSFSIKTNTVDVSWQCKQCDESSPTWTFTVPRQYLGGFAALHLGTEGCVESRYDTYIDGLYLRGGELMTSTDPNLGACCFDHTTCTDNQTQADCELAGGVWQGTFTECAELSCCGDPFADYDYDGDVDQVDFGFFQTCYTGSRFGTIPDTPPECDCFDRHPAGGDGDVDVDDFIAFTNCWSGPTVPAVPSCDD